MKFFSKKTFIPALIIVVLGSIVFSKYSSNKGWDSALNFVPSFSSKKNKEIVSLNSQNSISNSIEELQTKSGLKVLFLEDKRLPYISFKMLFLNAGGNYDGLGKKGLSSLTSGLLDHGAGDLTAEELQEQLNFYGTSLSVFSGSYTSGGSLEGASWHVQELWDLFLKVLTKPHLKEKEFQLLQKQFLAFRKRSLASVDSVSSEVWYRQFFSKTDPAYGSATVKSLKNINLEDVKSFYTQSYKQGEFVLSVVGQFDLELKKHIMDSLDQAFVGREKIQIKNPNSQIKNPSSFVLLTKDSLAQSKMLIGFPMIAFPTQSLSRSIGVELANVILGAGFSSRLVRILREERGLTYSVYSQASLSKQYGIFKIAGATKTKSTKEFLVGALEILKEFQEKGVTQKELDTAKALIRSAHLREISNPERLMSKWILNKYHLEVSNSIFINQYADTLDQITLEEVNNIIKENFVSDNKNILIYGPSNLEKELSSIPNLAPLKTISFEEAFSEDLTK